VRPTAGKLAVALLAAFALSGALAISAGAQIAYTPCREDNNFACARLNVPLDPTGATSGTLTLALRRHRATVESSGSAVIALAGGPGQEAIPLASSFATLLGTILATRDLIVFDQRGTGESQQLKCPPPKPSKLSKHPALILHKPGEAIVRCADEIGPARAFYTTPDSVADIEAIRRAGGYEKLVLYGTSYGTKVAEQYAQDHPEHVEALVLDSVVPPNGPDPFDRPTFAAVPRVLRQLCAYRECAHITPEPVADLARLVRHLGRGPVVGRVVDGHGHAHPVRVSANDLVGILLEGDFNALLRAEFVPAARAAAQGDPAALARLLERAEGPEEEGSADVDLPLYLATSCEEQAFPWSRGASPAARLAQAQAQLNALPASAFAPFTQRSALALSDLKTCSFWPFATPAPPVDDAPLPNVPTLIVSGAADLRTPTSGAQEVAAQIPDAHLLVVPYGGHSAIENEPSACGRDALQAMFAEKPIKPCRTMPPPPIIKLPPLPPRRLAQVPPRRGYGGRPGRTLNAVALTLDDFAHDLLWRVLDELRSLSLLTQRSPSLRGGGLRAGFYAVTGGAIVFHDYTFVPGVTLSGRVTAKKIVLRIGGPAAARGVLRLGPHRSLVGTLGGQRVRLARKPSASAAIVGADAGSGLYFIRNRAAAGAADRRLAGILAWLPGL
jgi:pimeloyl-ACP methyl ester carboxylesterase